MSADEVTKVKDGIKQQEHKQNDRSNGSPKQLEIHYKSSVIKVENATSTKQSIDVGNINFDNLDDFLNQENDDDIMF